MNQAMTYFMPGKGYFIGIKRPCAHFWVDANRYRAWLQ